MNKYFDEFAWDSYRNLQAQYLKLYEENKELKENFEIIKNDYISKDKIKELLEGGDSNV